MNIHDIYVHARPEAGDAIYSTPGLHASRVAIDTIRPEAVCSKEENEQTVIYVGR